MLRNSIRKARAARSLEDARDQGFTLIELLIVIVILGILAGVVVFSVRGITDTGEDAACAAELNTVRVASEAFRAQQGNYAANEAALVSGGFLQSDAATVTYATGNPPTITSTC